MLVRLVWMPLTVVSVSLGCSDRKTDETGPRSSVSSRDGSANPTSESLGEDAGAGVTIEVPDRQDEEIKDRNEAMLARLREEEVARKAEAMSTEVVATKGEDTVPAAAEAAELLPSTDKIPEKASRSSMEEFRDRIAEFEPRIGEISKTADVLDDNYRRYFDACYQKSTTAGSSGSFSGHASGYSYGAAAGRDWFAVYGAQSDMAYGGTYSGSTSINNETTPYCRELWSDIVDGAREINQAMKALQQDAKRKGVLPGHMRDLRRKYRLDWKGWTK